MPENRPHIPAEIEREIMIECGRRCAVCGTPTPLERAHIIPWHKSKEHKAEDLVCLCANCHSRSHKEKWGDKELREYKKNPWILRIQGRDDFNQKQKVKITIDMELDNYDEKLARWLQSGLAGFLEISPKEVAITRVEKGSIKLTMILPVESVGKLLEAYKNNNLELLEYIAPYKILDINPLGLKGEWFSVENLKIAWKYVRKDVVDDFIFDVIDHADIKTNIDKVINTLNSQIKENLYYPAPLVHIDIPKNYHSFRPGTSIPVIDLIYLYAIAQQLAPHLDSCLSESAYAYRLNPKAHKLNEPLFRNKADSEKLDEPSSKEIMIDTDNVSNGDDVEFPYNWFFSWKAFHNATKAAVKEYQYVAVTDITAFFENISLDLLRERIKEILGSNNEKRELIDRLFRLLEFWDWNPVGNLPRGIGLPQGNDVSSFLSNLYLLELDKEMLSVVSSDTKKYYRYVDDVKLFTGNKGEAQKALVTLERVLRGLNLHTQSAKTKIEKSDAIFNKDVDDWVEHMSSENDDKEENAKRFFENVFSVENLDDWRRAYLRCLTVMREANDSSAVNTALNLFLENPSNRLIVKNFLYLRNFVTDFSYSNAIFERLSKDTFTFPYHRGYIYRLAAYCRDEHQGIKELALQEATNQYSDWFCRMSSLFALSTFSLSGDELNRIAPTIQTETHPLVTRAAYVVMCQHSGDALRSVIERLSLFSAPHQEYLQRYFLQLYKERDSGERFLNKIEKATVDAPTFIFNLHQLDLLKANKKLRNDFKMVVNAKITDISNKKGERLKNRLQDIYDKFVVNG